MTGSERKRKGDKDRDKGRARGELSRAGWWDAAGWGAGPSIQTLHQRQRT